MGRKTALSGKKIALLLLILIVAAAVWLTGLHESLTFENLKENRDHLRAFVEDHYTGAAFVFVGVYMSTAFFVPGAIALTLAAGFLFGVIAGTVYVNIGATSGAALAFLLSRYVVGNWVQRRFEDTLKTFNKEISRHGHNYLLTLRIIPVLPFFAINYLAGVTRITLKKFLWTTSLGMLPGSLIYTLAGRQLRTIDSVEEILSPRVVLLLLLMGLFALLPVGLRYMKKYRKG